MRQVTSDQTLVRHVHSVTSVALTSIDQKASADVARMQKRFNHIKDFFWNSKITIVYVQLLRALFVLLQTYNEEITMSYFLSVQSYWNKI